jgi:hypothetical protein
VRAAAIDEYLASRQSGSRDYVAYNTDAIEGREEMRRELGLDPAKPVVSLFTNVLWDAQLYYNYTAFSNMIEWLFETIRYFRPIRPPIEVDPEPPRRADIRRHEIPIRPARDHHFLRQVNGLAPHRITSRTVMIPRARKRRARFAHCSACSRCSAPVSSAASARATARKPGGSSSPIGRARRTSSPSHR